MKRNSIFVLSLVLLLLLLTGCTKGYYEKKGDKYFNNQDYENAEKYYLKALEKESDPNLYIKLADLYRENYDYDREIDTIKNGMDKTDGSIDLNIRYAQYLAFMGNEDEAMDLLLSLLQKEYSDKVMEEMLNIYLEYGSSYNMTPYCEKFKDDMKNVETKILAYESISSNSPLEEELKEELINSKDEKAYEVLLKKACNYMEYDNVEYLIYQLESINKKSELPLLYSELLTMKDCYIMNHKLGHFINRDKKDMVVIYKEDYSSMDIHLALIDGKNGDIVIDKKIEDIYPEFLDLDVYERRDELDQLAVTFYLGSSASSGKSFSLYEFSENEFKEVKPNLISDVKIELLEGFKIQVESESLKTKYVIDIPRVDRLDYIENGQFDENGMPITGPMIYMDGLSVIKRGDYKDTIKMTLGFGGTYRYSADRLAYVEILLNEIDGNFNCTAINIENIEGMSKEVEYVEGTQTINMYEPEQANESKETYYPDYLIEEDFKLFIGDKTISVESNIDEIIEILGPGKINLLEQYNEYSTIYEYKKDGLSVTYLEKNDPTEKGKYNIYVTAEKPGVRTVRGLEVGMDKEKVEELYGLEYMIYENGDETLYIYQENEDIIHMDLFIVVDNNTNMVTSFYYASNL